MTDAVDAIVGKIQALELDLEREFAKQRAGLRYGVEDGRVLFEEEVIRRHRDLQTSLVDYIFRARPLVVLSAPVIYSLIIPFAIVDLWTSLYQAVCFRVYGVPQVPRGRYMAFDRVGLRYLNALEKLNCGYCSYVIAYVREVASRTEQYWCPIKHARRVLGAHARYSGFEEYGQGEHYQQRLRSLRAKLAAEPHEPPAADGA